MRRKGGSFLFSRCHSDLAAVGGDDCFGNEQPEVERGILASDPILILPAWQRVKDSGDSLGANSAFIMNAQDYFRARAFRPNGNRRGLQRVQIGRASRRERG